MTTSRFIITTLVYLLLCSCNNQSREYGTTEKTDQIDEVIDQTDKSRNVEYEWNYREVNRDYLDSLWADICSTEDLEFLNLYPIIDSIASDQYENLILVDSLKARDFEVTNWGREIGWKDQEL